MLSKNWGEKITKKPLLKVAFLDLGNSPTSFAKLAIILHIFFKISSLVLNFYYWWTGGESNPQTSFRKRSHTPVLRPYLYYLRSRLQEV
ncbi:MAG: hypothetical protein UT13_C0001G0587 [Candidatus Pacebacteria bacterium GW2011_GWF2_38_9]|nr:MAG: hypothetical protein US20_C0022G0007 [Candidatus Pacebacteria bacterium GW2011_GWF1_36_5]KKQ88940.1 MAG: hypothetical protein UT13_C0001G0587 [Candidatus Pacebacteria bacterium GW2011_GWF2_38_9]HAZ73116.1 hypothetical protein [Candidatus Paceibacterota bacterium]